MSESSENKILADLKLKNDELASKLYQVNERLKESESFKSHFISNITNEIVNPFSSILALSANIQKLDSSQMCQVYRMAELIHEEAFHLDFQLKNVFATAMIEAGQDELMPVSVNLIELVNQSVSFFDHDIKRKNLTVIVDVDSGQTSLLESFLTDESKFELIVKNLLSNAVKYSHQSQRIYLKLEIADNLLKFSVRDYGKGIPEAEYAVIFDRFKQLDSRINSINTGHGLGLSIVNAYIQFFNGTIELATPAGGGLEISVSFPEMEIADDQENLDGFLFNTEEKF